MDSETLKRRIAQELNDQFEGKLREVRREKTEMEEELESASERWRVERRRLNSEIDRLEATLTEVKATVKKPSETTNEPEDKSAEWAAMLTATEDRLNSATKEWEGERAQFVSEIKRLQESITEILERSNNPVRSLHAVQQKLEAQLLDVNAAKARLEVEFGRAKAVWEEERVKMAGELFRLRRGGGAAPEQSGASDEALRLARAEIERLERRITETQEAAKAQRSGKSNEAPTSTQLQELTQRNSELARELQNTIAALDEEKRQRANVNEDLQQARAEIQGLEAKVSASLSAGEKAGKSAKGRQTAEMKELSQEKAVLSEKLDASGTLLAEEKQRSDNMAEELRKARDEIRQLERNLDESRKSAKSDVAGTMGTQNAADRETIAREKAALEDKLESADALLTQERQRVAAAHEELKQARREALEFERRLAEKSENGAGNASQASADVREEFEAKLREMANEKSALAERLENVNASLAQEKRLAAAVTEELKRTRNKVQRFERKGGNDESGGADASERTHQQDTAQVRELEEQKKTLAEQLESANRIVEEERRRAATAADELLRSRMETEQLERKLAETRNTVSADVVEQLRMQYSAKLEEIAREKTELAGRLESASTLLEQERERFATAAGEGSAVDNSTIEEEVARVESAIAEITQFIDDPSAQLAAVIRKNVERAELDAYLKGILFARGNVVKGT